MFLIQDHQRHGDYTACTDETGISAHRYMIVGGVSCRSSIAQQIHASALDCRKLSPFPGDSLEWKNLRANSRKLDAYFALMDLFFYHNRRHELDLTAIVVDTRKLKHAKFNQGDAEEFFQKIVNHYTRGLCTKYKRPQYIRLFHGSRTSRFDLRDIQNIINSTIAKQRGEITYRPLSILEYMPVGLSGLHNITDVLLGALGFYWNGKDAVTNPDSDKAKLARFILAESPVARLNEESAFYDRHFDIWDFQLSDNSGD